MTLTDMQLSRVDLDVILRELDHIADPLSRGSVENIRQRVNWIRDRIVATQARFPEPFAKHIPSMPASQGDANP